MKVDGKVVGIADEEKSIRNDSEKEFEIGIMTANMGSCECGNVSTRYIVDHESKRVYVIHHSVEWMDGHIDGKEFCIPYAGSIKLSDEGYEVFPLALEPWATEKKMIEAINQ